MKEIKEITVSISDRTFNIDFPVKDKELIEIIFDAVTEYVNRGFSIKVRQTYMNSPSDSVKIVSKIISKGEQMGEWKDEIRQLISVLRK